MIKRQWLIINDKMRLRPEILFFFFIGTWNLSCSIQWKTITKTMVGSMTAESFLIALIHVTPHKSRVKQTICFNILYYFSILLSTCICILSFLRLFRSSPSEVFLGKNALKICSKFVISIKLLCNFTEIALRHGWSLVNLVHIFRAPFPKKTYGEVLLIILVSKNVTQC